MTSFTEKIFGLKNFFVPPMFNGHPMVVGREVTFVETAGAGVYTGSVTVPAGATIIDIKVRNTVLWTATTSATLTVGDVAVNDGFFTGINMKATDLLIGVELNFIKDGGKPGAYLVQATGYRTSYSAAARIISGIITTVGAAGAAGRTRMVVAYLPASANGAIAAIKV